ncbi:PIG-L family deacetylase [Candidatus Woesearchaeota archaeon]|nr:PIG-L family deacetylase [Candidatus Woesearchaeota archaeon]
MAEQESILIICAHNDDQIIGMGGTIAKYAAEGKKIHSIFFSLGEGSHPHLKTEVITKQRYFESKRADEILGATSIEYLGFPDTKIGETIHDRGREQIKQLILQKIEEHKPGKIFTNATDDTHHDHRAVAKLIQEMIDEEKISCAVYVFEVWHLTKLKGRHLPKLVVNTSEYFSKKIEAFKQHKSQWLVYYQFIWKLYFKERINGKKNKWKYAEVFYKVN